MHGTGHTHDSRNGPRDSCIMFQDHTIPGALTHKLTHKRTNKNPNVRNTLMANCSGFHTFSPGMAAVIVTSQRQAANGIYKIWVECIQSNQ